MSATGGQGAPPAADPLRRRWPVVIAAGLPGSASTWAYNVVRLLLEESPAFRPVRGGFADMLAELPEPTDTPGSLVIKTHQPDRSMRLFARATAAPVVLTVRDPRDAVVSLMQRFGESLGAMRAPIIASAHLLIGLASQRPVLVLRYEDGFSRSAEAVQRIAAFLGQRTAPERLAAIAASLLPERVAADVAAMTEAGAFGEKPEPRAADPVTQWHPSHVGDGRVGKWREVLSEEDAAALMAEAAIFCRAFGYGA